MNNAKANKPDAASPAVTHTASSDIKAMLVVIAIAGLCGLALAGVRHWTASIAKERMKKSGALQLGQLLEQSKGFGPNSAVRLEEVIEAGKKVLPSGCNLDFAKGLVWPKGETDHKKAVLFFPGFVENGSICGIAAMVTAPGGYSGDIELMVGFTGVGEHQKLTINFVYILAQSETPGLGAKIANCQDEPSECGNNPQKVFLANFIARRLGQDPRNTLRVKKDGGQIDAITGATISSRAVADAVARVSAVVKDNIKQIKAMFKQTHPKDEKVAGGQ